MVGKEPSRKGIFKVLKLNRKIKAGSRALGVIAMVLGICCKGKKEVENREMFLDPPLHIQPVKSTCSEIRQVWI